MNNVGTAVIAVLFPVAAAIVGSLLAIWRPPGAKLTSAIQHFTAGVVLAAVASEILPDLREEGNVVSASIGFVIGVALMLLLSWWSARVERSSEATLTKTAPLDRQTKGPVSGKVIKAGAGALPIAFLVTVAIDLVLDGTLVGLGTTLGQSEGIILTIALTLEIVFLALSVAATLVSSGLSKVKTALLVTGLGLLTAVGAVGGAALLSGAGPAVLAGVLAFGCAALLYLALEELLTEAHEVQETPWLAGMLFLGFGLIYLLSDLAG